MAQHAALAANTTPPDSNAPAILNGAVVVSNSGINLLNVLVGANTYKPVAGPAPVLWFEIESITDPKSPTSIQKKYPGVPYPARVGASAPAATTRTAPATGTRPKQP
jgi:hypothetical protein